ncbi:YdcF family protein [Stanieria cyanosphaera]|nr:YdcF family protein [Stanieria cyanosphaera]
MVQIYSRSLKLVILLIVGILSLSLLFNFTVKLSSNAAMPVDAFLVLGGSINREIYAAKLAKQYPKLPILISQGSEAPCLFKVFQKEQINLERVILEKCAESTFGNFFFSLPILTNWKVHKVKLITSKTHLPRAKWLANIILGSHGIWIDLDLAPEKGIPGNQEFALKTIIDVIRSLGWSYLSQLFHPTCDRVDQLSEVDLSFWQKKGFVCERQTLF